MQNVKLKASLIRVSDQSLSSLRKFLLMIFLIYCKKNFLKCTIWCNRSQGRSHCRSFMDK
jgi:hypothetical protein